MKKKNISKKVLAVLLSFVMIATSVPLGIMSVAAGEYDPAPKFSEDAQIEGADAWLDDEGNVQVTFPAADAEPTYKGEALSIAFYILELVDMGSKSASHTDKVLDTIKVTGTSGTFAAADIGTIDLENKRYSVTVTAVDEENWFSQPIYATVTSIPAVQIDTSRFDDLSISDTAVREMMTFDMSDDDTGVVTGNALRYMGVTEQTGTENLDGDGDTSSLRFIMYDSPSGAQTFDTSMSRQTWSYANATEIWYWMDLADVELTGVSFRLRAQEKEIKGWGDGNTGNVETLGDRMGSIVYSTKGTAASTYTGEDPYVKVQREDGGWDTVYLDDNGTIDLGNFKGYVRVPIEFMCSETDAVITARNDAFNVQTNQQDNLLAFIDSSDPSDEQIATATAQSIANINGYFMIPSTVVDPAGTCVTDALLLQKRVYQVNNSYWYARKLLGFINSPAAAGDALNLDFGLTPAVQLNIDKGDYTDTDANRATVSTDGTIGNRENAYKAIDDIYSAGFAFEGCSTESLSHSFFVDNIFFYDKNGGPWTENKIDGMPETTGSSMSSYYDEKSTIQGLIFDEIDKYLDTPGWEDYREIDYILGLIDAYEEAYANSSLGNDWLSFEALDAAATSMGRDSWTNAVTAYSACLSDGTIEVLEDGTIIVKSNAGKNDLVPTIVRTMEKLPAPENITSVSNALREEILKIWKGYTLLNLGQLEMLGSEEEKEILEYIALLDGVASSDGNEFVVGQRLANYPYIIFNDFETNTTLGEKSYQVEDDRNVYSTEYKSADGKVVGTNVKGAAGEKPFVTDWRHLKSLTTYTPISTGGVAGIGRDHYITDRDHLGYSVSDSNIDHEIFDGKVLYDAAWATITDSGYNHSKAATVYSDSAFVGTNDDRIWHAVTISRNSQSANTWKEFYSNNTKKDGLGYLANPYSAVDDQSVALSVIFYVDFTELNDASKEYYFTVNIFTRDGDGDDAANVKLGVDTGLLNQDRKYWILDNETGEWEIIYTTNQYGFNFSGNADEATDQGVDANSLHGYKGYLMVPLYHIKDKDSNKLDEKDNYLNNIYAIQFACGGADMDEKSFTIDNVGFTYDPRCYTTGVTNRANAGYTTKSYAELFGAKSSRAVQFEEAVAAIDIYDESTRQTAIDAAYAIWNDTTNSALPTYQKQLASVAAAKATLDEYQAMINNNTVPEATPDVATIIDFTNNTLTDAARNAKVSGKSDDGNINYDIPYPGFSDGAVDYSKYGLTKELADQVIYYYENGYKHLSKAEKATVPQGFLNAYNASMRLTQTLESIRNDAVGPDGKSGFLGTLTDLYTVKYDYPDSEGKTDGVLDDKDDSVANSDSYKIGNFVSIAGRDEVKTYKETNYDPLQYYSKTSIDDGSIYSGLQNTSRGFTYFLNNTREFVVDGETIEGGILTFRDKMDKIYKMANDHITNKTLFSPEELQSVKDIIEEYNAMLPAYYNIEELYELEQAIIRLFPVASTEALDVTEVLLTEEKLTGDASTYKVTYSEILDYDGSGDYYFVRVTSANGAMTNDYGDSVAYKIAINSESKTSDAIVAASPYTATVTNNAYTPASPMSYVITPSLDAKPTGLSGTVRDTLTVELVLMEDGEESVVDTQSIEVSYSMGDAYTVTIPASFPVLWDDSSAQDVSYSVTTEMVATSKLTVGVTSDGTGKMVSTTDPSLALNYTTENFVDTEFGNRVKDAKPDPAPTVSVSGWDDVPVGEYKTTLTYTVVYDDGDGTT